MTWNSASSSPAGSATSTPPIIQIDGANPARIHVGDTYNDLGATITGPQADHNLALHTFVGSTPIEQAVIDTSAPVTYHINYVATDSAGITATSTRTVIVEANPSTTAGQATSTPSDATASSSPTTVSTPPSTGGATEATTTNATSTAQ